jgi:hypothetical protein
MFLCGGNQALFEPMKSNSRWCGREMGAAVAAIEKRNARKMRKPRSIRSGRTE